MGSRSVCFTVLAFLLSGGALAGELGAERPITLRSGRLSGPSDVSGIPPALRLTAEDLEVGGPALLRFSGPIGPETRAVANRLGIRLSSYIGEDAYIALLPEGGLRVAEGLPGLAWSAPFHPGLRIAPALADVSPDDARSTIPVTLHLFPSADVPAVRARLAAMGLEVTGAAGGRLRTDGRSSRPGRVVVLAPGADLARLRDEIATWPETLWLDRRPVYRLLNDESAWVLQSGTAGNSATPIYDQGLYGSGQLIGILDTGLDADMCFFRDDTLGLPPITEDVATVGSPDLQQRKVVIVDFLWSQDDPLNSADWDDNGHGTHVAGSAAGDKATTPGQRDTADGMAPAAKFVIQDGGFGFDNCADLPAIGCPAADLVPFFDQAYKQGARIHTNSWGDRENSTPLNIYSDGSEAADSFMWDHPDFLLLFAAGNSGPSTGTVASPATAKNVIAVGATGRGVSADILASFSSRGPVADGRIKPDVMAPGQSTVSADADTDIGSNNCGTTSLSGTSMASPTMAGTAALVREYYTRGFYPTGSAAVADEIVPSAALLKATLIASAAPMGFVSQDPPSDQQGWGIPVLDDALFFSGESRRLRTHDVPSRFASPADAPDEYAVEVLDSALPLRVVLTWTDYPSTPAAATNLVNDLDLEVDSPTGTRYLGNVFSGGASQTGGTRDSLNNVEAVRIESPEVGSWTVRIRPRSIPEPSQGYALVTTGRIAADGVALEQVALAIDDSVGGNADGLPDPGEWIDLPVTLRNSGDTPAANLSVQVESLTAGVDVVSGATVLPDLATGQQAQTTTHVRIHLAAALRCASPVSLRFTYAADSYSVAEEIALETGAAVCEVYDPAPNPVDTLRVGHDGTDVILLWNRPAIDVAHGEAERYKVHRSITPLGIWGLRSEVVDPSQSASYADPGAAAGTELFFYDVISTNPAGDSE